MFKFDIIKIFIGFLLFIIFCMRSFAAPLQLTYFQTGERYSYRIDLLKLAMDKTIKTDGPYSIKPVGGEMSQGRGILFLQQGKVINIGFFPSNKEREKKLLPIKIPILR